MAKSENIIYMEWDTQSVSAGVQEVSGALGGLKKVVSGLGSAISKAMNWSVIMESMGKAMESSENLEKELLLLRLRLGKLKAAFVDAVTPLAAVFIPVLNQGVLAAIRLVTAVGKVIGALFAGAGANEELEENAQNAAKAETKLASSVGKVKRSLAGFDQINRLEASTGSGSSAKQSVSVGGKVKDTLTPQLQSIVDKIQSLLEPLKKIDFTLAVAAFARFREAVASLGKGLFSVLEWAWHTLLVPLAKWSIENVLPAFLDLLSSALQVLNAAITAIKPLAIWLWDTFLQPIAQWTGGVIVAVLQALAEKLKGISDWILENQGTVRAMTVAVLAFMAAWGGSQVANWVTGAGGLVTALGKVNGFVGAGTAAASLFNTGLRTLAGTVGVVATAVAAASAALTLMEKGWYTAKTAATSAWESICTVWGKAEVWMTNNVINPLDRGCRKAVNGIIGVINAMLSGLTNGMNSMIKALNKLSFSIPAWVPGIGGQAFGLNLKTMTAPQIPYLAKGAVLPANKPFMAIVGDQRHGTNVEAPLQTIQEAVAVVMEDFIHANMAGHEATVQMLRQILEAVLGIQIGDEILGQAVSRYQRKMAVVRGG